MAVAAGAILAAKMHKNLTILSLVDKHNIGCKYENDINVILMSLEFSKKLKIKHKHK